MSNWFKLFFGLAPAEPPTARVSQRVEPDRVLVETAQLLGVAVAWSERSFPFVPASILGREIDIAGDGGSMKIRAAFTWQQFPAVARLELVPAGTHLRGKWTEDLQDSVVVETGDAAFDAAFLSIAAVGCSDQLAVALTDRVRSLLLRQSFDHLSILGSKLPWERFAADSRVLEVLVRAANPQGYAEHAAHVARYLHDLEGAVANPR